MIVIVVGAFGSTFAAEIAEVIAVVVSALCVSGSMTLALFIANAFGTFCIGALIAHVANVLALVVTLALISANVLCAFCVCALITFRTNMLALVVTLALVYTSKLFTFKVGAIAALFADAHASVNPLAVKDSVLCNGVALEIPR